MTLIELFKKLYPIDEAMEVFFTQIMETKEYQKGDIIFGPESYLKHIYYVEEGFTRIFYFKNAKDITHNFYGAGSFSTGVESLYYHKPSLYGFQALTASKISCIPYKVSMRVVYNKFDEVYINPNDQEEFFRHLHSIRPNIVIK